MEWSKRRQGPSERRAALSGSDSTKPDSSAPHSSLEFSFPSLRPTHPEISENLSSWRSALEKSALEICQYKMRDKIKAISQTWMEISGKEEPPANDDFSAGLVHCHPTNMMLIRALKQEVSDLTQMADSLQLYLTMQFPKSQSAMPFHTEVMKQIIGELKAASLGCGLIIRVLNTYINSRAYVISELLDHPSIEDYHRTLTEYDNTHSINIRRWLYDLETTYAILEDTILKNWDRIFKGVDQAKPPSVFR